MMYEEKEEENGKEKQALKLIKKPTTRTRKMAT